MRVREVHDGGGALLAAAALTAVPKRCGGHIPRRRRPQPCTAPAARAAAGDGNGDGSSIQALLSLGVAGTAAGRGTGGSGAGQGRAAGADPRELLEGRCLSAGRWGRQEVGGGCRMWAAQRPGGRGRGAAHFIVDVVCAARCGCVLCVC